MENTTFANFRTYLISKVSPSFIEVCLAKEVDIWSGIVFKYDEIKDGYVYYQALVPSKMICPCKKCGHHFNTGDNYVCLKDRDGSIYPDICKPCFEEDNYQCRAISTLAIFSLHDCKFNPANLPKYA